MPTNIIHIYAKLHLNPTKKYGDIASLEIYINRRTEGYRDKRKVEVWMGIGLPYVLLMGIGMGIMTWEWHIVWKKSCFFARRNMR